MIVVAERRDAMALKCPITCAPTAYKIGKFAPTCQLRLFFEFTNDLSAYSLLFTARLLSVAVLPRRSLRLADFNI